MEYLYLMTQWSPLFKRWQSECVDASSGSEDLLGDLVREGQSLLQCMSIGNLHVALNDQWNAKCKLRFLSDLSLRARCSLLTDSSLEGERESAYRLFEAKNRDYGDAFVNYGAVGILVRLGDKFSRLASLWGEKRNPEVQSESVLDTLVDIHNYCIMVLMVLDKRD